MRIAMSELSSRTARRLKKTLRAVFSPTSFVLALLVGAIAAGTAGVYVLQGLGWALVAGSVQAYVFAIMVARGASNG